MNMEIIQKPRSGLNPNSHYLLLLLQTHKTIIQKREKKDVDEIHTVRLSPVS
jgi:hypothetical protein